MDKTIELILKTEYSQEFDERRKNAMAISYYKYGPAKENYARSTCPVSATENIVTGKQIGRAHV